VSLALLRYRADLQSLLYMTLYPSLVAWQWAFGLSWILYPLMLYLGVGLAVVQHNHTHLKMWRVYTLNRLTELWLSALQGSPCFVFYPTHIAEHHKHHGSPEDLTAPVHFGGHHTSLRGYLLHPFQALYAQRSLISAYLTRRVRRGDLWPLAELMVIACGWVTLLSIDWRMFILLVLLPQLHSAHWLLGANYLQHAHPSPRAVGDVGQEPLTHIRNFTGWMNFFWFNIGYHSAHHQNGKLHWSELPTCHQQLEAELPQDLIVPSMAGYMIKTYLLGQTSQKTP